MEATAKRTSPTQPSTTAPAQPHTSHSLEPDAATLVGGESATGTKETSTIAEKVWDASTDCMAATEALESLF
jgi:hypothetical protein